VGQSFICGEQSPTTLIEKIFAMLVARPDVIEIDHPVRLASSHRVAPNQFAIPFCVFQPVLIRFFLADL
jgi:hypothetical protein